MLWSVYIIKGPPNDIYFIIEGPYDGYFTEKVSQAPLATASFHSLILNACTPCLFF